MNQPLSNKIIIYSSLLFTAVVSLPKLLALQRDGIIAAFIPFNVYEWLMQDVISFLFCYCIFLFNRKYVADFNKTFSLKKHGRLFFINAAILAVFTIVGGLLSRKLFFHIRTFPLNGYFIRLMTTSVFIFIEIKILVTLFYAQQKEKENEQLRLSNMRMELDLLKAQLNPHFFFNALSSLSGVVREDPQKAQQYISHLSKIFRYSLNKPEHGLVTLKEELAESNSYSELMKMRHEGGFNLDIKVDTDYLNQQLPQLSLQPLIENALKHNISTTEKPLHITISATNNILTFTNNLQPKLFAETGTGIGLANLNDRFKILVKKEIDIIVTKDNFIVKLPLI